MEDATATFESPLTTGAPLPAAPWPLAPTTAELAECSCPDWCERDHDRD